MFHGCLTERCTSSAVRCMDEHRKEGPVLTEHKTQDALSSGKKRVVEIKFRITYYFPHTGSVK